MERLISFDELSHVEYNPSEILYEVIHRKGEPVHYMTMCGKHKISKKKFYEEDVYAPFKSDILCDTHPTKSEMIRRFCFSEKDFDSDGNIISRASVTLHFLNGDKHTKYFDSECEALDYFEQYKMKTTISHEI